MVEQKEKANMRFKLSTLLFVCCLCVFPLSLLAQSGTHRLTRENISLVVPDDWLATKLGKKLGDYGLRIKKTGGAAFVEINCIRKAVNTESKITTLASERSNKESFEYMQIDEVSDAKLGKLNAKKLVYTNTFLTDTYRGGIYGLVDNGYTYTIEYYGADTPEGRSEIEKILRSIKIDKPLAEQNIVEMSETFVPTDWNQYSEEETAAETESDQVEKAPKKSKTKEEKLSKEEKKAEKEKAKRLKEETKKVEEKQKALEKKKKEAEKAAKKADNERKKAEKQLLKEQKKQADAERRAEEKRKKAMKAKKDDSETRDALDKVQK